MGNDTDAADAELFEEGNIAALLAKYDATIVGRCAAKLRGHADADDVAQNVKLRLLAEFQRGKRYPIPYRGVVHQVIQWTVNDYFGNRPTDVPLPEGWEPAAAAPLESPTSRLYLETLFEPLPERQREVALLRYLHQLEPAQIAEQLGIEANAVYQALHNAHRALRDVVDVE